MKKIVRIAVLLSAALCMAVGATGAAASGQVSLDGAFDPERQTYSATVAHDVTEVTVTASPENPNARVTVNGGDPSTPVALVVGENTIVVVVTAPDARYTRTYTLTVTREAAPEPDPEPQLMASLTAAFESVPSEHDGAAAFALDVRFSEALGETANAPAAGSFAVKRGEVKDVRKVEAGLWRVRIAPKSWKDVTVTLAGGRACTAAGAVCTADGRSLTNTSTAAVGGPARIRVADARGKEGKDETLDFAVTLNRAAGQAVSVDYATADGTATAGADYTATSGTLTFAPGETAKTVSVPLLDDSIDEGRETFKLKLSNPRGAYLRKKHRQAKGVIRNSDPLQAMWLARFGRMVASDAVASVTARLETPRDAGSHLTVAGAAA